MVNRKIIGKARSTKAAEIFSAGWVACFFLLYFLLLSLGIIPLSDLGLGQPLWKRVAANIPLYILALPLAWSLAELCGKYFASNFLTRTLEQAISATKVMQGLGLYSSQSLFNFTRLYGLDVYRVDKELNDGCCENIRCRLEPLFATYAYSSLSRNHYYAKNLFYLDKKQVDAFFDNSVMHLSQFQPETIQRFANVSAQDKIKSLMQEIDELQKKLEDKNREEGPHANQARHRLYLITHLYAAIFVRDSLLKKRKEDHQYTIDEINDEYKNFVNDNASLKKLLTDLKTDANLKKLHPHIMALIRSSMEPGTVTWGGNVKASVRNTIHKISKSDVALEDGINEDT